jgi:hypothetical protein
MSAENAEKLFRAEKVQRAVYTYTIPTSIQCECRSFGMVEITSEEEIMAEKRAAGDRNKVPVELTKQAIVEADGKPMNTGDGSVDALWAKLPPKVRTLMTTTYYKMHIPSEDETASFFGSVTARL